MSLAPHTRLGPYEIVSPLGAGGMGVVYRATDTALKRDVAIKVLPDAVVHDAERLARFEREAQVLATLNHPHIAQIYGLERSTPTQALVMELVEGEDLSTRIARGPIAFDEALPIARQIAEALEAAHERGIVHRDLKPANIKVTTDGVVKVLDFGLAKLTEQGQGGRGKGDAAALSMSPTITSPAMMTGVGVILGTAAYMSPEQAKGREADKRSDVWAFGCVLYEMLTGRRAFEGEDVSDTLAAVLRAEPDWTILPADVPPLIRRLVTRCLEKDRRKRIADISTALFLIDEPSVIAPASASVASTAQPRTSTWRQAILFCGGAAAAAVLVGGIAWNLRPAPPSPAVTRFSVSLADGQRFTNNGRQVLAMSPDGTRMTYVANTQLYLRSMGDSEATPIAGTNVQQGVLNPVFSPDGRSIAFWASSDETIKRISVDGGRAVTICPAERPFGMSWGAGGILFGQGPAGIMQVNPNGGKPEVLLKANSGEIADSPEMLPDGQHLLFTVATGNSADRWDAAKVVVQSAGSSERKTIIEGGSDARYLPTGHIVYAVGGTLFAVPFDLGRLEVTGQAVPILEGVSRAEIPAQQTGIAHFSVSSTGSLMYVPGTESAVGGARDLVWLDRKGSIERLNIPSGAYEFPRVSPDGKQLAFDIDDGKEANVWVYDLAGTSSMRRLTFGGSNRFPVWSADSERVAYQSDREGDRAIFWQRADGTGTAERVTKSDRDVAQFPDAWAPRGQTLLFSSWNNLGSSLWAFSTSDRKAELFGSVKHTSASLPRGVVAPDGRWVAYDFNESGFLGVYVQPFPATGAKFQIAKEGHSPVWTADGRQLIFANRDRQFAVVDVSTQPTFSFGNPAVMSAHSILNTSSLALPRRFDVAPDGRIIGTTAAAQDSSTSAAQPRIEVVLNWFEALRARVPAD